MLVKELENELLLAIENPDEDFEIESLSDVYDWVDDKAKRVAKGLDTDNHRWYQVATDVYQCDDGFLGVRGVNMVFSEGMCVSDCGEGINTFSMYKYYIESYTSNADKAKGCWKVPTLYEIAKWNFVDQLLEYPEIKECINDRHVDLENLEESCMVPYYVAEALRDSGLVDEID